MSRPKLLDLFCCAGGAGMGYSQAGFDVVGYDINPQPRYPFEFRQADVLGLSPADIAREFDGIHASPPCQANTSLKTMHNARPHLDLIPETRALLNATGLPWIMENVVGAPLIEPVRLCGTMFGLGVEDADLWRHRDFEASFPISAPGPHRHGYRGGCRTIGIYGEGCRDSRRKFDKTIPEFTTDQGREAMGCPWMTTAELSQAIPPAYTEYLGRLLLSHIEGQ